MPQKERFPTPRFLLHTQLGLSPPPSCCHMKTRGRPPPASAPIKRYLLPPGPHRRRLKLGRGYFRRNFVAGGRRARGGGRLERERNMRRIQEGRKKKRIGHAAKHQWYLHRAPCGDTDTCPRRPTTSTTPPWESCEPSSFPPTSPSFKLERSSPPGTCCHRAQVGVSGP